MNSFLIRSKKFNNKGFTLIELLVVIIIIGILAGIAVIGISGARSSAQKAACKADANQLLKAIRTYSAANNSKFPKLSGDFTSPYLSGTTPTAYTFVFDDIKKLSSNPNAKYLEKDLSSYLGSGTVGSYILVAGISTNGNLIVSGADSSVTTAPSLTATSGIYSGLTSAATNEFPTGGGDCTTTG